MSRYSYKKNSFTNKCFEVASNHYEVFSLIYNQGGKKKKGGKLARALKKKKKKKSFGKKHRQVFELFCVRKQIFLCFSILRDFYAYKREEYLVLHLFPLKIPQDSYQ